MAKRTCKALTSSYLPIIRNKQSFQQQKKLKNNFLSLRKERKKNSADQSLNPLIKREIASIIHPFAGWDIAKRHISWQPSQTYERERESFAFTSIVLLSSLMSSIHLSLGQRYTYTLYLYTGKPLVVAFPCDII